MDGVFGQSEPEPTNEGAIDEADIYLGYAKPPREIENQSDSQVQNQGQEDGEETSEGDESAPEASGHSAGSGEAQEEKDQGSDDPAKAWEQEKAQYQQQIQQYEQALAQLIQMFQVNPYAQVPGPGMPMAQGQQGAPMQGGVPGQYQVPGQPSGYTVDPMTGYPVPQGPVAPMPAAPSQVPGQAVAAPAAPQVSDEELQEQFWQDPVKAAKQLVEREWNNLLQQRLLPLIQQREAYFGQVFGSQIMAPLVQQLAMVQDEIAWRDKVAQEYQSLRAKHEDFDQVAPVMRQILAEDPQRFAKLRQGQETLESLYQAAKKRAASTKKPLTAVPGGKAAARMPKAGAARVPSQGDDNDALVEAALGPMSRGGIWG